MTDPKPDSRFTQFLRRITFLDMTPDKPGGAPVHVTQSLLLDGVEHRELLDPRFGWQVFALGLTESLVSFVANAEHVNMGTIVGNAEDGHQVIAERALCGIPVLTPTQEDHPWEVLPEDEVRAVQDEWRRTGPDRLTSHGSFGLYDIRGYKAYPYARVAEPPKMIRVFLHVREVEVIARRPAAGDRVTDGGIVGTLVRCEQCSGDGLLHKPDPDAMPPAQQPQDEVPA